NGVLATMMGLRSLPVSGRAHRSRPVFESSSAYKRNRPSLDQSCVYFVDRRFEEQLFGAYATRWLPVQVVGTLSVRCKCDPCTVRRPERGGIERRIKCQASRAAPEEIHQPDVHVGSQVALQDQTAAVW